MGWLAAAVASALAVTAGAARPEPIKVEIWGGSHISTNQRWVAGLTNTFASTSDFRVVGGGEGDLIVTAESIGFPEPDRRYPTFDRFYPEVTFQMAGKPSAHQRLTCTEVNLAECTMKVVRRARAYVGARK